MVRIVLDILTIAALLFGLFFMFIGALGVWRLPDVFNRMHAGSKCVTLGISGMLVAAVLHFAVVPPSPHEQGTPLELAWQHAVLAFVKAALVVIFQYITAPVGIHILARAAHLDGAGKSADLLADELEEDRAAGGVFPSAPLRDNMQA